MDITKKSSRENSEIDTTNKDTSSNDTSTLKMSGLFRGENESQRPIGECDVNNVLSNGDSQSEFVNIGYQNWLYVRQEWKKRPANWTPPKREKKIDVERIKSELPSGNLYDRVPLSEFIKIIVEMWETDGVN